MIILFDTYAWIEYFRGSSKAKKVQNYLKSDEILTPTIVLAELSCKAAKENWDIAKYLEFIKSKSLIITLTEEIIINTGNLCCETRKQKPHFSLPDAIILTTAIDENSKTLTGDKHFKGLREVEFL